MNSHASNDSGDGVKVDLCLTGTDGPFVVTFSNWHPLGAPHRPFSKGPLSRLGINAAHVISDRSDWYCRSPSIYERVFSGIRDLPEYQRATKRIGIGSSMGGYGAIKFRKNLSFDSVIAICPQYSISGAKVPEETRWREEANLCDFSNDHIEKIEAHEDITLIYDPTIALDCTQVSYLDPSFFCNHVKARFSGHPPGEFFAELGLYDSLMSELIEGKKSPEALKAAIGKRKLALRFWQRVAMYYGEHPKFARHIKISKWAVSEGLKIKPEDDMLMRIGDRLERLSARFAPGSV